MVLILSPQHGRALTGARRSGGAKPPLRETPPPPPAGGGGGEALRSCSADVPRSSAHDLRPVRRQG